MKERDRACTLALHRLNLSVGLEWRDGLERGVPFWAQRGEISQQITLLTGTVHVSAFLSVHSLV